MKKGYYIFMSQMLAALISQKPFFIAKRSKASEDIANVFISLNIIKSISIPNKYMQRSMQRIYKPQYLAYWLEYRNKKNKNKINVMDPARKKFIKTTKMYNKIEIIGKKSVYHQSKMSFKQLICKKPYSNTIYIMQTSKGLLTSTEAIRLKLGGFVLCKINLLKKLFFEFNQWKLLLEYTKYTLSSKKN